ncbi:MAG: hypothetical protein QCI82_11365, partial [Candidatus Thermoplasmatota archaeon]|nr:hypothetical protein [Candidatus Thermoplasmatota archaeon]
VLKLNRGTLRYHLDILIRYDLITSRKDGNQCCFAPVDNSMEANRMGLDPISYTVLRWILDNPGSKRRDLRESTGLDNKTLTDALNKLKCKDYITVSGRGNGSSYEIMMEDPPLTRRSEASSAPDR